MKVIVGKDVSRTNIQVPPQYTAVSEAHVSVLPGADGLFLLEDLNSANGTFVFDGASWQRISRINVYADTPILMADFRTTIAELLGEQHQGPPPHAASIMAQGGVEPAGSSAREATDRLPFDLALKVAGIGDLLRILTTLHAPMRGIRQLVAEPNKALYQALLAYVALVTAIPFLHKEVIMRIGAYVNYPIIAQGEAIENALVLNVVAAVSSGLGFLLMYSLPKALYQPSTRTLVVASNIYTSLYVLFYTTFADLLKFAQYAVTTSMEVSIAIGLVMMVFGLTFQVYVWRKIMQLRWWPIVLFLVIGLTYGFLHGFILAKLGLIKFAAAGGG